MHGEVRGKEGPARGEPAARVAPGCGPAQMSWRTQGGRVPETTRARCRRGRGARQGPGGARIWPGRVRTGSRGSWVGVRFGGLPEG